MGKLLQLEKYRKEEEKEKKKEESQRKKDLQTAKKKLNREITTTKGAVKKRTNEVTKLKSALNKLEAKHGDTEKKKAMTASKMDETIRKTEEKHNQAEVDLATKIGEMGEARGTLAYLEYAQEMLEKGVMLARDPQSELAAAAMGRQHALSSHETHGQAALTDSPEKIAEEVAHMRQQLEVAEEERLRLERESGGYRSEWQEELQSLRGQVGQLRDENQALRHRLDQASSTVRTQDDRIETLRSRLQMATATMKEKVERIEELTETVAVPQSTLQADVISPSSGSFQDGHALESASKFVYADEAGGLSNFSTAAYQETLRSTYLGASQDAISATFSGSNIGNTAVEGIFQTYPETANMAMSTATEVPRYTGQRFTSTSAGEVQIGSHHFTELSTEEVPGALAASTIGSGSGVVLPTAPTTIVNAVPVATVTRNSSGSLRHGSGSASHLQVQDDLFDFMDTDRDGVVSRVEFKKAVKAGLLAQGGRLTTPEGIVSSTTAQPYVTPQTAYGWPLQLGGTPRSMMPGANTAVNPSWMVGSFNASRSSSVPRQGRTTSRPSHLLVSPPVDQLSMTSASLGAVQPQVTSSSYAGSGTYRFAQATTPPVLVQSSYGTSRDRSVGRFGGAIDATYNYTPAVGSTAEAAYASLTSQQVQPALSSSYVAAAPQRMVSGRLASSPMMPALVPGGTVIMTSGVPAAAGHRATSSSPPPPSVPNRLAASTLLRAAPLASNRILNANTPRQALTSAAATSAIAAASAAAASLAVHVSNQPQGMPTELIARDQSELHLAHERAQANPASLNDCISGCFSRE